MNTGKLLFSAALFFGLTILTQPSYANTIETVSQTCTLKAGTGPFSSIIFSYQRDSDGYLFGQKTDVTATWVKTKARGAHVIRLNGLKFLDYELGKAFRLWVDTGAIYSFDLDQDDKLGVVAYVKSSGDIDTFTGYYLCENYPFQDE